MSPLMMHHDSLFEVHRKRVAKLGAERNPRYLLPHKPLAFLALVYASGRGLGNVHALPAVVKAYKYLADKAQQWPPRPLDAVRQLHRSGFLTLQGEDGRDLPRQGPLPLTQRPCKVTLPPDLAELLAEPDTRERLLAAGYFQFCEEQKEGMAGLWDELGSLLARRDEMEALADPDTRPMMPQRPVWLSLSSPSDFVSLLDLESQVLERIERGRPALLGQIPYDEDAYEKMCRLLSARVRRATYYPASLSLFLVWTGIMHYGSNTFWPEVQKRTELTAAGQTEWGRCFEAFLAKHGLPAFLEDLKAQRYVTPILGHGGIPKSCLPDLFAKLIVPAAESADTLSGREVRQEACRGEVLATLHMPVQRFLKRGGRVADDFLERCLTMAREVLYEGGASSASEVLGLPPHVVETFHEWLEGLGQRQLRRQRFRRPYVKLRPGTSLHLYLPSQRFDLMSGEPVQWVFDSQGRRVVKRCRLNRRGEALETEADEVPWPHLLEACEVSFCRGQETLGTWTIEPFLEADETWLFVDPTSGRRWHGETLPRGEIWFLRSEARLEATGAMVMEEAPPLIARGQNWNLTQYDLGAVMGTVCVDSPSGRATWECEPPRPTLRGGERLENVETDEGSPIYLELPCLHLPDTAEDFSRWVAVVRPVGLAHPAEAFSRSLEDVVQAHEGNVRIHLDDLMPADAAGQWEIGLRGPLGRTYTFRVGRVPNLLVTWEQDRMCASAADGIVVLDGSDAGSGSVCVGSERFLTATFMASIEGEIEVEVPLRLWVPRWRWRLCGVNGVSDEWSRARLHVCDDSLFGADEPLLLLEIPPGMPRECVLQVTCPDGTLQEEHHRAGRDGSLSVGLRPFFDTLRLGYSASHLLEGAAVGQEPVTLLRVVTEWAPQNFVHEVARHDLLLAWQGGERIPSRAIRLVSQWSPEGATWRFDVPNGSSELMIDLDGARLRPGQYRVEFLIEDDWSGESVRPGSAHMDLRREDWAEDLRAASTPAEQVERLVAVALNPHLEEEVGNVSSLVLSLARAVSSEELQRILGAMAQHLAAFRSTRVDWVLGEAVSAARRLRYCSFEDCRFVALSIDPRQLVVHLRTDHAEAILDDMVPILGYDEYKRRYDANLPAQIYRCNKCTNPPFYVTASEFPRARIQSHINSMPSHAGYAQFSLIRGLEEIRRYVLPHIELTRVCRLCDGSFVNKPEHELLHHVLERHVEKLFRSLEVG